MTYLLTMAFIFTLLVGGIAIDKFYHRFAARNPKLGPFRPEGIQDCCHCEGGDGCGDKTASCGTSAPIQFHPH